MLTDGTILLNSFRTINLKVIENSLIIALILSIIISTVRLFLVIYRL